ncbi:MAG: YdeI/OmpD-associated family protein, partial [Bacteroidales bacterium]|nr:YdeI/OmpD-associated family protein [Bacteroidales bacterium]
QTDFRKWLEANHQKASELLVGYYKVKSGKPSMTWSESVDQALCFGWIDSVRRSIDDESYCIRFTPRKKTSVWSAVNIEKIAALKKAGIMTKAGLDAFAHYENNKTRYSRNENVAGLPEQYETLFKQQANAWQFFQSQSTSHQQLVARWVMSAKQEKTQLSRLEKAMAESAQQKRVTFT